MANPYLDDQPSGQSYSTSGRDMNDLPDNSLALDDNQNSLPPVSKPSNYGPAYAGMRPELADPLHQMIADSGGKIQIHIGYRSHAYQAKLYKLYQEGKGHLAAKPGTSNHEFGLAADLSGDLKLAHELAPKYGLVFPVSGEAWHVEPKNARQIRKQMGHPY